MKLKKVDYGTRLYVIENTCGISCIGFDVMDNRALRIAKELNGFYNGNVPHSAYKFQAYKDLLEFAHARFNANGIRFECELHPKLHGCIGDRVEVTFADGHKERFRVGKSTGCMPCYLRLKNRRSIDGTPVDRDEKINFVEKVSKTS